MIFLAAKNNEILLAGLSFTEKNSNSMEEERGFGNLKAQIESVGNNWEFIIMLNRNASNIFWIKPEIKYAWFAVK